MIDLERQLKAGTKNVYPHTIGITGEVFKTREIVYGSVKALGNFIPGLDNQAKEVKDVRSICVLPVFGHAEEAKDKDNLVAIVQLVNRKTGIITEHDLVSF